ncbi:hypothetical protein DL96DRAFT_1630096 [Flagelloscypha sp. PMI_526]|nr:hypothetical protein DL96DRAFT_1630096 [Flagelloscypha sp. PMI_526]
MLHLLSLIVLAITASVQAAPVSVVQRQGGLSGSYKGLPQPILSPYYVYFGVDKAGTLSSAFDNFGVKTATIGFVSALEGKCELSQDLDQLDQTNNIKDFVAKGGSFKLSFGGNLQNKVPVARQHVQQACTDDDSLTKLIRGAMDRFQTHNIDFDIEDNDLLSDDAAAKRLANALVNIKKDVPDAYVTYTLGAIPSGMGGDQLKQLQAAKDAGLDLDATLLMTMNFGTGDNVAAAQSSIAGGAKQIASIFSINLDDATKRTGMVPAIGVDDSKVVLDLNGAKSLADFAKQNQLSTISYWNFMRDFPGGDPAAGPVADSSSSPDQKNQGDFFKTMSASLSPSPSFNFNPVIRLGTGGGVKVPKVQDITPSTDTNTQPVQKGSLPPLDPASISKTSDAGA